MTTTYRTPSRYYVAADTPIGNGFWTPCESLEEARALAAYLVDLYGWTAPNIDRLYPETPAKLARMGYLFHDTIE